MTLRPNDWPEAEARFRIAYRDSPAGWPRTAIHWRLLRPSVPEFSRYGGFLPSDPIPWPAVLVRAAAALMRGERVNEGPQLAVWHVDDAADTHARLIFECEPMPSSLEGDGTLVGDFELNGTLCVELTDGQVVWPIYNPRPAAFSSPRR